MLKIYDNPEYIDRYTVFFGPVQENGLTEYLGLSHNPGHPQGFSQFGEAEPGPHCGKRILAQDLPDNVWEHIKMRLEGIVL